VLRETGLVDRSCFVRRIVPCGNGLEINMRRGIFFRSSDSGYSTHAFTDTYRDKRVQALWENDGVFNVRFVDGKLDMELVSGGHTDEYDERLRVISVDAGEECGYAVAMDHRFICGVSHATGFEKVAPGGIMGRRYADAQKVVGDFTEAAQLAANLASETWE
jgi:hypothetical protein